MEAPIPITSFENIEKIFLNFNLIFNNIIYQCSFCEKNNAKIRINVISGKDKYETELSFIEFKNTNKYFKMFDTIKELENDLKGLSNSKKIDISNIFENRLDLCINVLTLDNNKAIIQLNKAELDDKEKINLILKENEEIKKDLKLKESKINDLEKEIKDLKKEFLKLSQKIEERFNIEKNDIIKTNINNQSLNKNQNEENNFKQNIIINKKEEIVGKIENNKINNADLNNNKIANNHNYFDNNNQNNILIHNDFNNKENEINNNVEHEGKKLALIQKEENGEEEAYSYQCENKLLLNIFLFEGSDEGVIKLTLANNGKRSWPKNTKLVFDDKSLVKGDEIMLDPQNPGDKKNYEIVFKNLKGFSSGEYKSFLSFNVNGKNYGEILTIKIVIKEKEKPKNEIEEHLETIKEFRDTFGLSKYDYTDEKTFNILKKYDFDMGKAFESLFE